MRLGSCHCWDLASLEWSIPDPKDDLVERERGILHMSSGNGRGKWRVRQVARLRLGLELDFELGLELNLDWT